MRYDEIEAVLKRLKDQRKSEEPDIEEWLEDLSLAVEDLLKKRLSDWWGDD